MQLGSKLQFLLPLPGTEKIFFNTLAFVAWQLVFNVLIGSIVDRGIKLFSELRIRQ